MTTPEKPDYTHGSSGTQPGAARDYVDGDAVDPEELDYFINELFWYINNIISAIDRIDSDGDGQVDAADIADEAANCSSTYKGNDLDSDGDGVVDGCDETTAVNGVFTTAGSLPHYNTETDGLNDTEVGDVFYDDNTNTVVVNKGQ